MRPPVTAAEVLREARRLIEKPECWLKNEYEIGESFCALGALFAIGVSENDEISHACSLACEFLKASVPDPVAPIVVRLPVEVFNDEPTTTHADVLALFDRAIAAADQHNPRA